MFELMARLINTIGAFSSVPYFYRNLGIQALGQPINPILAANETVIESKVGVYYPSQFIKDNIAAIHRSNTQGVKEISFTFNLDAFKQQHGLEYSLQNLKLEKVFQIHPNYEMTMQLKSLVYAALLTLEKFAKGKIKFYEAQNVTNGPMVFIANCGTHELENIGGFHTKIQFDGNYAYRSLVCLRDLNQPQHTLQIMLHEFLHMIGVKELREHPEAIEILKQQSGAFSSVMFYFRDRHKSMAVHKIMPFHPHIAFIGDLDKKLIEEIINLETSPDLNSLQSLAIFANSLRQCAISFCWMYVFMFCSQLKLDNNSAMILARSCTIMLMWHLDTAPESIIMQACLTFIDCTYALATQLGFNHESLFSLLMLPISLMSIVQHITLLSSHNALESAFQLIGLLTASSLGAVLGAKTAELVSPYLPMFRNNQQAPLSEPLASQNSNAKLKKK